MTGLRTVRSVTAIAVNTFREAVRNKVFASLFVFAIILSGGGVVLGQMSLHEEVRVTRDFSVFLSTIFAVVIAIYSSVTLLHTEIEHRTIYTILSKPLPRWQFLLGKYVGVLGLLLVLVGVLFGISLGLVLAQGGEYTPTFLAAFVGVYLQLSIITALALFFASFSSPLLSGLCTAAFFIIGNLFSQLEAMKKLLDEMGSSMTWIIDALQMVLPNLESLNLANQLTYSVEIPADYIASAVWYAASYTAIVLLLSMVIFSRRDFN